MPDSTNSASESEQSNNETDGESRQATDGDSRQGQTSQIEEIAALLQPPTKDADADADADDKGKSEKLGESQEQGIPKTINALAERLGVDVKDLFDIEFALGNQAGGDGESRTLGQLKDLAVEHDSLEVDRLRFEETKTKREAEFVRANAELQDLVNMLPKNAVSPELLQVVANKRAAIVEREKGLTLTAIPEWNDSDTETTDRTAMREHLGGYGFSQGYLESVTDHKTLKYIRDNMQRQQRIERVLAQVKQVNKPGHKPSAKATPPAKRPARAGKQRTVEQQTAEVAKLLTG